jgi:hypothetical protein
MNIIVLKSDHDVLKVIHPCYLIGFYVDDVDAVVIMNHGKSKQVIRFKSKGATRYELEITPKEFNLFNCFGGFTQASIKHTAKKGEYEMLKKMFKFCFNAENITVTEHNV